MQIRKSFDTETLVKIGKGALIAMGGALCTYLLEALPNVNLGDFTPVFVGVFSILINAVREWFKGQ